MKKRVMLFCVIALCFILIRGEAYAMPMGDTSINPFWNDKNSRRVVNPVRYRKTNVRNYTSYSNWKRVSSDLTTGSGGGSISCSKEVKFSGSISGKIKGISVSFGGSKRSKVGYTLHVGPNQTRHMVYRVQYAVESGTREVYDAITGKVISRNSYTAKKVVTGEYALSKLYLEKDRRKSHEKRI